LSRGGGGGGGGGVSCVFPYCRTLFYIRTPGKMCTNARRAIYYLAAILFNSGGCRPTHIRCLLRENRIAICLETLACEAHCFSLDAIVTVLLQRDPTV